MIFFHNRENSRVIVYFTGRLVSDLCKVILW